jgi:UDP:flavonoid glycosyltransferase YjiC (YdhE family)
VAFDLKTATPTPEQVRHAVHVVVSDPKYRKRVSEMKKDAENYDSLTKIARKSMRWQRASMQVEPSLKFCRKEDSKE